MSQKEFIRRDGTISMSKLKACKLTKLTTIATNLGFTVSKNTLINYITNKLKTTQIGGEPDEIEKERSATSFRVENSTLIFSSKRECVRNGVIIPTHFQIYGGPKFCITTKRFTDEQQFNDYVNAFQSMPKDILPTIKLPSYDVGRFEIQYEDVATLTFKRDERNFPIYHCVSAPEAKIYVTSGDYQTAWGNLDAKILEAAALQDIHTATKQIIYR